MPDECEEPRQYAEATPRYRIENFPRATQPPLNRAKVEITFRPKGVRMSRQVILNRLSNLVYSQFKSIRKKVGARRWESKL
jgi:hypothetical protein